MRLLVCGGRDYKDRAKVFATLDRIDADQIISVIVTGDASGADELAREWSRARCVPLFEFFADWNRHGKAAGPIRNRQMLAVGGPDMVLAFSGGRGTANMIEQAEKAGLQVVRQE